MTDDVIRATRKMDLDIYCVIAGLGGRPITKRGLKEVFEKASNGTLEELHFLDLDKEVVEKQLKREKEDRHTGPLAEAVVRDSASIHKGGI